MKKTQGFTLIEMIITIVIIIVLSSISVPMYKGYKRNAIESEGYVLLSAIRDAQMVYYHKYRNFLGGNTFTNNGNLTLHDKSENKGSITTAKTINTTTSVVEILTIFFSFCAVIIILTPFSQGGCF